MSLATLLQHWQSDPAIAENIVAWRTIPARQAECAPFPDELHPALVAAVEKLGIEALYSHQAETWEHVQDRQHVAIVTDTASGKTLAYNLPVLDSLLRAPAGRALYLYPTKALAQDQLAALGALTARLEDVASIVSGTYDGDTPDNARVAIRNRAQVMISNPDMLHIGILPHHTKWAEFFENLCFVIIDEMHTYRGIFGSHVANVIRRLKRIAAFYGARPQFVLTSATIGNPGQLAEALIEEPVSLVTGDGSARGPRHFLIYNPPLVDPDLGLRASMVGESVRLAEDLLSYDLQSIIFGRTRRTVEVMLKYLDPLPSPSNRAIRAYRSGYLPEHRREIERGLRDGDVRAVVATTALELGIDIGAMAATVLAGYPGTIAGTWQQAGRAGRSQADSLAVLVTSASPLDQFLARHPEYFFESNPEHALINPDHLLILLKHLQCAAFELPFKAGERFGNADPATVESLLDHLGDAGILHPSKEQFFWMGDRYPSADISLRSASANQVTLYDDQAGFTFGEVDRESAPWMVHPGAIYLHEGKMYRVDDLDLAGNNASLRPVEVDYYTRPRREAEVQLLQLWQAEAARGGAKACGELSVVSQVSGYEKIRWENGEKLGFEELDLPPSELLTAGYWLSLDDQTVEAIRAEGLWRNDPNDYGPSWSRQRDAARRRDGYRCQVCGQPEGEKAHHVHHKVPLRAFETPAEANRLSNLVTLCPACHRRAESAVRIRSGLAGLGYALHHLAPLLLMCDRRDLGVHTDPQSPLADGKPTVAIYETIPTGIGFSQRLYQNHQTLLGRADERVRTCDCADGCPSCVGPGGEEGSGGKAETLAILEAMASK